MKWFWRIHKVNDSFDFALKEIGGCPFKNLDRDFGLCQFVYLCFNDEIMGDWSCKSENDDGVMYSELIKKGFEFKGNVGIKELRKNKLKKLNEAIH